MEVAVLPDTINGDHFHLMDLLEKHPIENDSWSTEFPDCNAMFSIAHTGSEILLKFYIKEPELRVTSRRINGEVHRDNCVELFISWENDEAYYNVEFNCLGNGKIAYGNSRYDRKSVSPELVSQVGAQINIRSEPQQVAWEILLTIPTATFCFHNIESLNGKFCRANFYKCGDDLEIPHFLSWRKIITPTPDFHQPAFFGNVNFAS